MSNRIMRFYTPEDADLPQVSLDPTKSTAVIIHRSTRAEQEPSLSSQEQLVSLAMTLRREETIDHITVYTEGLAPEGPFLSSTLLEDITNGRIGSIITKRPDRLVWDLHTLPISLLQKQQIIVIVPGKEAYNLGITEDFIAFYTDTQRTMWALLEQEKILQRSREGMLETNEVALYHVTITRNTEAREILLQQDIPAMTDEEAITEADDLAEQLTHRFENETLLLEGTKIIHQESLSPENA